MENIVDTFYNQIIPEMLQGEVLCGIKIRIVANVLFVQNGKELKANPPIDGLNIPTLKINNNRRLDEAISKYVNIMNTSSITKELSVDKEDYIKYFIASAIANMASEDYDNPEIYFEKLCYVHTNNPIPNEKRYYGFVNNLNSNLTIETKEEIPTQECPYVFIPKLYSNNGNYNLPIIRYYILDNTAYIGAIQNTKSSKDEIINNKIRRFLYKANAGVPKESDLLNVDPAVICSLSSFLPLMKSYDITNIELLPYSFQRSNDKKLKIYYLNKILENPQAPFKARVTEVISQSELYFERLPKIRSQLETSIARINYHFEGTELNEQKLNIENIQFANNDLLEDIYQTILNKKQGYQK